MVSRGTLPETSNFCCLPGRAGGGSPRVLGVSNSDVCLLPLDTTSSRSASGQNRNLQRNQARLKRSAAKRIASGHKTRGNQSPRLDLFDSPEPNVMARPGRPGMLRFRLPAQAVDEDVDQAEHVRLPAGLVVRVAHAHKGAQKVLRTDV